jgi:hypothetical protein
LRQTASGGDSHGYQLGRRDLVGNGLTIRLQVTAAQRGHQRLWATFPDTGAA